MRTEAAGAPVADDMERIFAPLAGRSVASVPQTMTRPPRQGRSLAMWAALAALAGSGAVAVAFEFGTVPPPQTKVRPVGRATAAQPSVPERETARFASLRVADVASETPPAAIPSPTVAPLVAAADPVRPQANGPLPLPRQQTASVDEAPVALPNDKRCAPDSPEDHCIYRDVMSADARLRRAYERAADAGVSPSWLASINRRWERARDVSRDDPDHAIDRFDRLANALDEEREVM